MTSWQTYHSHPSEQPWRDPDLSILDNRRGPVPVLPLALLPQPWCDWIADGENSTGAPADYVFQSVLAGAAALCGAGVRVRVTPTWNEPLVLWQAVVGEASTGKSAALAPMRHLLAVIEQERQAGDEARRAEHVERCKRSGENTAFMPSQIMVIGTEGLPRLVDIVGGNPRGVLLWRDGSNAWIGDEDEKVGDHAHWLASWMADALAVRAPRQSVRSLARFPVSILQTIRPERLKVSLEGDDDCLAARFLFAWPGPQPYRALTVLETSRDAEILQRLRALSLLARSADDPCVIDVDARGRGALDVVLAGLHDERRGAEGLQAAWLGKSRSLIVRLAGILELLATIDGKGRHPGAIGAEQIETAAALWRDYFWPHAKAVFDSAELSDHCKRVRRVARWLLDKRPTEVSREEVRRRGLSQAATAEETQHVLERLAYLGFVRTDLARERPGRATTHWLVNPALTKSEKR